MNAFDYLTQILKTLPSLISKVPVTVYEIQVHERSIVLPLLLAIEELAGLKLESYPHEALGVLSSVLTF